MTDQEICLTIAAHREDFCQACMKIIGPAVSHPITWCDCEQPVIPNYPQDLNAMHEVEKTMTPEQRAIYLDEIYEVTDVQEYEQRFLFATARQRAEAYVNLIES